MRLIDRARANAESGGVGATRLAAALGWAGARLIRFIRQEASRSTSDSSSGWERAVSFLPRLE